MTGPDLDKAIQEALRAACWQNTAGNRTSMRKIIEAALASLSDRWQDISTAPETGDVLLWHPEHGVNIGVRWPLRGGWDIGIYYEDDPEAEEQLARSFTHWQPLPASPPMGRKP